MTDTARLSLLFEGVKLVGTGNGAGALASVAALYYFSSRPELYSPIKIAAVSFFIGLVIFAVSLVGYIGGICATTHFVDKYTPIADIKKFPGTVVNRAVDWLAALLLSLLGFLISLACFFVGTASALYALIRYA